MSDLIKDPTATSPPAEDLAESISPATSSDGDSGSDSGDYVPGTFEGVEKNLEILFVKDKGAAGGCRGLTRAALDAVCSAARCTILSSVSNGHLDAYVLSESSLFVYEHKMVLKTCGRTTLLRCLKPLIKLTEELGMELEWLGYSRKNYSFPEDQVFPHSSFQEEFSYLKKHPNLEATLGGSGHVLGPVTGDHWLCYVSDKAREEVVSAERTINIMMFDLDPSVTQHFYQCNSATAEDMTSKSGIDQLVPGAVIDARAFEPCGYSMNAILYGSYSTVHITPEPECSYASFETNTALKSYTALINNVLGVFKPGRVVVTMLADEGGLREITESPFDNRAVIVPSWGSYSRSASSFTKIDDYCFQMGNWELKTADEDIKLLQDRKASRTSSV